MSEYPRIKKFTFEYKGTYTVPSYYVGRLDKIAFDLYNSYVMYKPLAAANEISLPMGFRAGVRKTEDALRLELGMKGFTGTALDTEYNRIMENKRIHEFDWYAYYDNSFGLMSEVTEGKVLRVPTLASCDSWLKLYQGIQAD